MTAPSHSKPRRAAAYIRVIMGREDGISPDLQLRAIREYCGRRGISITHVVEDLDLSGRFWKTRRIDEAISLIEAGLTDALVVWRWSRVSRDRYDWAFAVSRVEAAGGELISATEDFDTTTSVGRLVRGILAEFAAFESDRMGDLWRDVARRRLSLGLPPYGNKQFGYKKTPAGQYVIDTRTGPILAEMYQRYIAGESSRDLAASLQARRIPTPRSRPEHRVRWSHQTLLHIMDRGFAAGLVRDGDRILPGVHPTLITQPEWETYLRRRARRSHQHQHHDKSGFLLTGLLHCSCGQEMRPVVVPGSKSRYRCFDHRGKDRRNVGINEDRVEGLVFHWLVRLCTSPHHAARARFDSREHADAAAHTVRSLMRAIGTDEMDATTRELLKRARTQARWSDPVEDARAIVEDWDQLAIPLKRERLSTLIADIMVRTGWEDARITITTTWGTGSSIVANSWRPPRCEIPAADGSWLDVNEACTYAGVCSKTLTQWDRDGLLPLTRRLGPTRFLYDRGDLDRLRTARRTGRGIDHRAIRAAILAPTSPR